MTKLYVLAEKIRSAYNVGSLFRTCDSAGVNKLFLSGFTPVPPHKKVEKTALGSTNLVEWEHVDDPVSKLIELKNSGVEIIGVESFKTTESIFEYQILEKDICLIFGNEAIGISNEVLRICDQIIKIPMLGMKDSLNISVSAGIAIYEFRRKLIIQTKIE